MICLFLSTGCHKYIIIISIYWSLFLLIGTNTIVVCTPHAEIIVSKPYISLILREVENIF